jgi:hypothetical protein
MLRPVASKSSNHPAGDLVARLLLFSAPFQALPSVLLRFVPPSVLQLPTANLRLPDE